MNAYLDKRNVTTYLEGIKQAGERASQIIKNMLYFSRKSGYQKKPVSLSLIIDNALNLAETDFGLKQYFDFNKINIALEYDEGIPDVECNQTEIEQVILNLVKNSAQALLITNSAKPKIILKSTLDNDKIKILIMLQTTFH